MGLLIISRLAAPFGMWETHDIDPLADTPQTLVMLRDHWQEHSMKGVIPRALDFTPVALRQLAGHVALIDLRAGIDLARYLWAGPALVELFGATLTGRLLSQCYGGRTLTEVRDSYRRMLEMKSPVFSDRRFRVFSRKLGYHRLLLPLLDDNGKIGFAILALLPKGDLRSAQEWRPLELELELNAALRDSDR